MEEKYKSK